VLIKLTIESMSYNLRGRKMNESNIFGLSIRGIISFIVVVSICTVCVWHSSDTNIGILKDLAIMILSFYFGQKSTQTSSDSKTTTEVKQ
jgi:hypothetical protein